MEFKIPIENDDYISLRVEDKDRIFIVGANGSGKSSLLHYLNKQPQMKNPLWISSIRQNYLNNNKIELTPAARENHIKIISTKDKVPDARWKDPYSAMRQERALYDLIQLHQDRNNTIANFVDQDDLTNARLTAKQDLSPINILNDLFSIAHLDINIKIYSGDFIVIRNDSKPYGIAEMSDGERNILLIAASILSANPGTPILLDEPERHLHRSIIEPFLSELFSKRLDCPFFISTHEIYLPITCPDARVLVLHSCRWEAQNVKAWDITQLNTNSDIPDDLKIAILGAKKTILFVEGNESSLDYKLYSAPFPKISVKPLGGCLDVISAVEGLRNTHEQHHIEAFGLIDRDDRERAATVQLKKKVYSLSMCDQLRVFIIVRMRLKA